MRLPLLFLLILNSAIASAQKKLLVFQTDFGLRDGAVAAMKGVALSVSPGLQLYDITHEIPAYNIWEAGYRLEQTAQYWPKGTVFVSVVDPGVGTDRRSIVLETRSGHYFVGPDNGQFTLVAQSLGIRTVHEIDETINRRKESGQSYTFHGRDVYAFTGARLAAGIINLDKVGKKLADTIVTIRYQQAELAGKEIRGNIPILDIQYGNVWTNMPAAMLRRLDISTGDSILVTIFHKGQQVYSATLPYVNTFGDVQERRELAYLNSLLQLSFAINMADFAKTHNIASGPDWSVRVSK